MVIGRVSEVTEVHWLAAAALPLSPTAFCGGGGRRYRRVVLIKLFSASHQTARVCTTAVLPNATIVVYAPPSPIHDRRQRLQIVAKLPSPHHGASILFTFLAFYDHGAFATEQRISPSVSLHKQEGRITSIQEKFSSDYYTGQLLY